MTDEQLEKQISEEFEKKWKEVPQPLSGNKKGYKKGFKDGHKAAALPLMKKIEESKYYYLGREVTKEFLAELISGWCAETVKLQKENEELRTSLSHSLLDLEIYSNMHGYNYWNAIAPEIRTKFNLDKNDKGAV